MTRRGKIARLPKEIRDELNVRLQDGEAGNQLVDWLNGLKKVQRVVKSDFGGKPITESNLSDWRQGGYADWERMEEMAGRMQLLQENCAGLDEKVGKRGIGHWYSTLVAAKLTELAEILVENETEPQKQWEQLCEVHRQISRIRRDDDRRVRTQIKQERWARELSVMAKAEQPQPGLTAEEEEAEYRRIFGMTADREKPAQCAASPAGGVTGGDANRV